MCYERTQKDRRDEQEARKRDLPKSTEPPASPEDIERKDVREREVEPAAV